jgi:hypothetical protein
MSGRPVKSAGIQQKRWLKAFGNASGVKCKLMQLTGFIFKVTDAILHLSKRCFNCLWFKNIINGILTAAQAALTLMQYVSIIY